MAILVPHICREHIWGTLLKGCAGYNVKKIYKKTGYIVFC